MKRGKIKNERYNIKREGNLEVADTEEMTENESSENLFT
jgi:hypothetical protein